jgi:hypothetical protein
MNKIFITLVLLSLLFTGCTSNTGKDGGTYEQSTDSLEQEKLTADTVQKDTSMHSNEGAESDHNR